MFNLYNASCIVPLFSPAPGRPSPVICFRRAGILPIPPVPEDTMIGPGMAAVPGPAPRVGFAHKPQPMKKPRGKSRGAWKTFITLMSRCGGCATHGFPPSRARNRAALRPFRSAPSLRSIRAAPLAFALLSTCRPYRGWRERRGRGASSSQAPYPSPPPVGEG